MNISTAPVHIESTASAVSPGDAGRSAGRTTRVWLVIQGLVYVPTGLLLAAQAIHPADPSVGQELTHGLVGHPLLRAALAVASAILLGVGVVMVVHAFRDGARRALPNAPEPVRRNVGWVSVVGSVGRALVFLLAGAVGLLEAATSSPSRAAAVVSDVRTFWQQPYGRPVLFVLAVTLVLFGVYEFLAAAYRPGLDPEARSDATSPQESSWHRWGPGTILVATAASVYAVACVLGWLLVHHHLPSLVANADPGVSRWFAAHRTPLATWLSATGSGLGDTPTILAVTAVAFFGLRAWLGRWRESVALAVVVVGELVVFLAVTATVHRLRPAVPHLDVSPPTSSFPSGHTGAAVALYWFLGFLALRFVTPRRLALVVAWCAFATPVLVGLSRIYRGMHYLTDVLAGAALSATMLTVVLVLLLDRPLPRDTEKDARASAVPVPA